MSKRVSSEVIRAANYVGLHVSTWSPGDGHTRYRFHVESGMDYNSGNEIGRALGKKEALAFVSAFRKGREVGLKLASEC